MVLYQSQLLGAYAERLIHGFSGKDVSFGGPGLTREELEANRGAVCEALGVDSRRLVVPNQVHSANIRPNTDVSFAETDGVVVVAPGVPVMLMFADCTPVVLYDPKRHVGAVVHAGWRGTAQSIAYKAACLLQEEYGCRAEDLVGVIGPAVGGCCYEVSDEVVEAVSGTVGMDSQFFVQVNAAGRPQVDLQTVNQLQLEEAGIRALETLGYCTRCEEADLFSYRRGENGRQMALLCLR